MPLTPGQTLSQYEILGPLGAGGMGEVYRARDTKLEREVAIKVLPEGMAGDTDRMKRFEREARTLAALNHPNLAHVYSLDEHEGGTFIAMELVPGEDLCERMAAGRLPMSDVFDIGHQIADGLEAAHEAGVVHRDLKPANVRITPDGMVKVLDFGLAKPLRATGNHVDSPTEASDSLQTGEGTLLGTPAYMSPEQARGRPVDRRTDIWALGCLLYESLAGKPTFAADSITDLLGAIASDEPDWSALPPGTPARAESLLRRMLEKDSRRRLRDIGEARLELEALHAGEYETQFAPQRRGRKGERLLVGAALLVGAVSAAVLLIQNLSGEPPAETPSMATQVMLAMPPDLKLTAPTGMGPPISVSHDGQQVAFSAQDAAGVRRVYLRTLTDGRMMPLAGTEGVEYPFISGDGKHIGFMYDGAAELKAYSLPDGLVQDIIIEHTEVLRGVDWDAEGRMVVGLMDRGLRRAQFGERGLHPLTEPAEDERDHRWPQILADGDTVVFTAHMHAGHDEPRVVSLSTGQVSRVTTPGSAGRYVATGHLVFVRSSDLFAVGFDIERRELLGEPKRIVSGIEVSVLGNPHFAVALDGSALYYEPQRPPSPGRGMVWVDREGNQETLATDLGFEFPAVSPDGSQVLVAVHTAQGVHDIYLFDAERGTGQLFLGGGNYVGGEWSYDGKAIVFSSFVDSHMYRVGLQSSEPELLHARPGLQLTLGVAPNGRVQFWEKTAENGEDVYEYDSATNEVRPLFTTPYNECAGLVSPDGKWLAYASDETSNYEVYVVRYPELDQKQAVTRGGGIEPLWSWDSRELFFRRGRGLYAVSIPGEPSGSLGEPQMLFEGDFVVGFNGRPNFDVTRDGQRFVMVESGLGLTRGYLSAVLDFDRMLAGIAAD